MSAEEHEYVRADGSIRESTGRLLARCTLLLFLVAIAIFNTRDVAWPAVSWPMFSARNPQYPGETYEANLIKALDSDGSSLWIRPGDLWGMDRYQVGTKLIAGSIDTTDPRQRKHQHALLACVRFWAKNFEVSTIEIWHLTWNLELDSNPALRFDEPATSTLIMAFGDDSASQPAETEVAP